MLNAIFDWIKEGFRKATIQGITEGIEELKGLRSSPESRQVFALLDSNEPDSIELEAIDVKELPTFDKEELSTWTKAELLDWCGENDVPGKPAMKHSELVELVFNSQ